MKSTPLRSNDIRERNEKIILQLIRSHGSLSQSQAVKITGLRPPTVLRIFTSLASAGYILSRETPEEGADRKGRKPSYYSLNPSACFAVGVDLSSQAAAVVIYDFDRAALYRTLSPLTSSMTASRVTARLAQMIREAIEKSGVENERVLGVGIGAPGMVDIVEGRVVTYARFRDMNRFPIREQLEKLIGLPVFLHNNCSTIALSEYKRNRDPSATSAAPGGMLAILIRAGVGGAFISDGNAYVSQGQTAVEIGHMYVDMEDGRPNDGSGAVQPPVRRSVEDLLSEDYIRKSVAAASGRRSWPSIVKALREGDPTVREALAESGRRLTHLVWNLAHVLNPDRFLIITRFHPLSQYLASYVEEELQQCGTAGRIHVQKIIPLAYDPIVACEGAAELVFADFLAM